MRCVSFVHILYILYTIVVDCTFTVPHLPGAVGGVGGSAVWAVELETTLDDSVTLFYIKLNVNV